MEEYRSRVEREAHERYHLYLDHYELQEKDIVYNYKLKIKPNNFVLYYRVESYFVNVFDSDSMMDSDYLRLLQESVANKGYNMHKKQEYLEMNINGKCQRIEVFDSWNISQVKDAYSRVTKKPFMPNDKILCGTRELEEYIQLWQLRIKDNENLMIEREQQDKDKEKEKEAENENENENGCKPTTTEEINIDDDDNNNEDVGGCSDDAIDYGE